MSLPILLFHQAVAQQPTSPPLPPTPRREISDPGIIATDQRVTPAGLQSAFTGRVTGVRFGAHPGEIWVTVPGALYRLGWRDNAVLASTAFDGHSGVQGIAIDSMGGRSRVFVSAVGKLPAGLALSRPPGKGKGTGAQTGPPPAPDGGGRGALSAAPPPPRPSIPA